MSVRIQWYEAHATRVAVYLPHPDAAGNLAGAGIDGDWIGHDTQGPVDSALVISADGCTALTGTLDELRQLADRIQDAITAAEEQDAQRELDAQLALLRGDDDDDD